MSTNQIKWIFSIARKNDIAKETVYEYIKSKHSVDSIKLLSKEGLDDVLKYVSDSRLTMLEKQLYFLSKKAASHNISRDALNTMAKKYGAHTIEELDEKGVRGLIAIVESMYKAMVKNAPRHRINGHLSLKGEKDGFTYLDGVKMADESVVVLYSDKGASIVSESYIGVSDDVYERKTSRTHRVTGVKAISLECGDTVVKIGDISGSFKVSVYEISGVVAKIIIRGLNDHSAQYDE